jgi:hypothetical protein
MKSLARLASLFALPLLLAGCASRDAAPASAPGPGPEPSLEPEGALEPEPEDDVPGEVGEDPIRFGDPRGSYDVPFFPEATYDPSIPTPDSILGQLHGSRLAHHDEILACYLAWAEASARVTFQSYGRTHEGRELAYAVVTSPENHARLDAIQADLARLHDARGLTEAEADRIVTESPASAWMGYSIHGDELSGADASLAVGYHLVAGQDADVTELLDRLVIVIDPCMNPDGRERIVGMVEQSAGHTPNLDYASMQRGRWPYGRGNHYLFDMNRDWMAGTQPETRGRWDVAHAFHPQLFVDAHEMGSLDTFLFYPQNRPIGLHLPTWLGAWQRRYAEDAAAAFDARGWSYYTREWADAWAPFYSDAWGALFGATGMLYEQAGVSGFPLRRRSGEVLTYREAVHHQAVASLANLTTLASNRGAALEAYVENARRNVAADTPGNDRMFVAVPGGNADRTDELLRVLESQRMEYVVTTAPLSATNVVSHLGERSGELELPAGSIVVMARQPMGQMVQAYLTFDPRMPYEDLVEEREEIERKGRTSIYDATSWSLPHALGIESYWCDAQEVAGEEDADAEDATTLVGPSPAVAWLVSGADDASVSFAVHAMEDWLAVHASDVPVPIVSDAPHTLPRGSLLVRAVENEGDPAAVEAKVMRAARAAGVRTVYAVGTGLTPDAASPETPDLGGGHFQLLARPRVALVGNSPVRPDTYGHLWFHLDTELGVPFSLLDAQSLGRYDLRRYNVLILPPGGLSPILEANRDELETWVEGGGTLIACGSTAAALTSGNLGISSVTLRRDALEDLTPYRLAAERQRGAHAIEIDEAEVWGDPPANEDEDADEDEGEDVDAEEDGDEDDDPYAPTEVPKAHDSWLRKFSPHGVTLRGEVDPDAWITFGSDGALPIFFQGSSVFLSKPPVKTAVRLASEDELRLSGLVWPEARERIADSAWLTVERKGRGQVILFASLPAYRGYHKASGRLFANAVVLGPGLGASQPIGW